MIYLLVLLYVFVGAKVGVRKFSVSISIYEIEYILLLAIALGYSPTNNTPNFSVKWVYHLLKNSAKNLNITYFYAKGNYIFVDL